MKYQFNVEIDEMKIDELIAYLDAFISQHSLCSNYMKIARLIRQKEAADRADLIQVYFR